MTEQLTQETEPRANVTTLAAGAGIALIGSIGGRGLFTISQIFLARWLGPYVFGLYAIGWTILRISSLFTPLGLDKAIIRFGAYYLNRENALFKKMMRQSLGLAGFFGLLFGAILIFLAPAVEEAYAKPGLAQVIRIFAIAIPIYAILRVATAATRITQRTQYTVFAENIVQPVTNILLLLGAFLIGWSLLGAVAAATLSFVFAAILALYYVWILFPQLKASNKSSEPVIKRLLGYSLPTALAGTFALSIVWIDQLFIGYFLPADAAGIYQAVIQSSVLFALILGSITAVFSPMIATYYSNNDIERLEDLYRIATKWGLYLNIPLLLVIAVSARELMIVVFGEPYASGWLPLRILLIGQSINILTGTVVPLLTMTGHQNRWFFISSSMFLLNMTLNLLLIPRFGLTGAAIGTSFATSGLFLLALFQVRHVLGIWPYDGRHLVVLVALIPALIIMLLYQVFFARSTLIDLVVYAIIAYGSLAIIMLVRGLDNEEKELFLLLKQRLASK